MYIVDSRPNLTAETICNISGQALGCFVPRDSDKFNSWKIDIPSLLDIFQPNPINVRLSPPQFSIFAICTNCRKY